MQGLAHYDIIYLQIMMTVQVWKYIPWTPKINMRSDIFHIINSEFLRLPHINVDIVKVTVTVYKYFSDSEAKKLRIRIYTLLHIKHIYVTISNFGIYFNLEKDSRHFDSQNLTISHF